jgi:hypothetical protein
MLFQSAPFLLTAAAGFLERSVRVYQITRSHLPEDSQEAYQWYVEKFVGRSNYDVFYGRPNALQRR